MPRRTTPALDSPNWAQIDFAHGLITEQRTRSRDLAATDLTEKLATGDVQSMRRSLSDGSRERLLRSFWCAPDRSRLQSWSGGLKVIPHAFRGGAVPIMRGWVFYVWLPEIKNIFGVTTADAPQPEQMQKAPGKRGRKAFLPWPEIRLELLRRLVKKRGNVDATTASGLASELLDWCQQEGKKAPADSDLREFISRVLRALKVPRA